MIVELRGVEFVNKGAELMLHAIIQKLRKEIPSATFVMEQTSRSPRNKHLEYGIFTKTNMRLWKLPLAFILDTLPKSVRRRYNVVSESEIDIVLDGSGFAFGDKWGAEKAGNRLANHIVKWRNQGKKVILLPQAFGPFTDKKLISKMRTIFDNASYTFARDPISYDYVKEIIVDKTKLELRPDFTNLIKGIVPSYYDKAIHDVAIIPNDKMIETAAAGKGDAYIELLKNSIEIILSLNRKPFFLIHESLQDKHIAEHVNRMLLQPIPVVEEDNPIMVKGLIGKSNGVITSRFHGLVSCLSQSVPCLATGWSHKYQMLLKDYDFSEALLSVDSDTEHLTKMIEYILLAPGNEEIRAKLQQRATIQKELSEEMWKRVINVINQ